MKPVDAILYLSFGGPESPDDVLPFLRQVVAGRNVPESRIRLVAEQYAEAGGRSGINEQNRALIAELDKELRNRGIALPIYFGNRNWHPFLEDTMAQMQRDGVQHAACFVTSAFSSYSGCRQYKEDIERSQRSLTTDAPIVTKTRQFYNHPGFVEASAQLLSSSLAKLADAHPSVSRDEIAVVFSAHSLPSVLAQTCRYEAQLREAATLIMNHAGISNKFDVVYQSRSGRPQDPWLGPDISQHLENINHQGVDAVAIAPLGFISDHQEVIYDLDVVATGTAKDLGMPAIRVPTVLMEPPFVDTVADLIEEIVNRTPAVAIAGSEPTGCLGVKCCPAPQ